MGRKKKEAAASEVVEPVLSEHKQFFIDNFRDSKSPEELAKELSVPVDMVTSYMESHPKKVKKKNFFVEKDGSTVMTAAQSMADDKAREEGRLQPKKSKRLEGCIHVIE